MKKIYNQKVLSIIPLVVLVMSLLVFNLKVEIVFAVDNTAFRNLYIMQYQYNTTGWDGIANFTTSGQTARIVANQPINFTVQIVLNNTYATSSSDALTFTWIGLNITYGGGPTYIFNNVTLNNATSAVSYGANSDWLVTKCGNWTTNEGLPVGGTTYTVQVVYEASY